MHAAQHKLQPRTHKQIVEQHARVPLAAMSSVALAGGMRRTLAESSVVLGKSNREDFGAPTSFTCSSSCQFMVCYLLLMGVGVHKIVTRNFMFFTVLLEISSGVALL